MLSKFSVKKPFTVFVSVILVVLLGVISFTKMTTDLLPSMDLPYVVVMTTYPGASPEKVELAVTKPLEQSLATTSGVKNINSISSENSSIIILEFEQSVNMDSILIEMNSYIDLAQAQFDDDVQSPMVMKMNPDMLPIMVASIDVNGLDTKEVTKIVNETVIPAFEKIDGVASVNSTGLVEEKIKIQLNQEKIDSINNKVLASVDEKLAEGKAQLDDAKNQLESGKNQLETQGKEQTAQLAEASAALESGKTQLIEAINSLLLAQNDLENQKADIEQKKNLLDKFLEAQQGVGIEISEKEQELLNELTSGLEAINSGISEITTKKGELETQLTGLADKEKELELGKLTLNQELSKASAQLTNSEAELNKSIKEFEASRDEVYKNAGIGEALSASTISNILKAENFSMPAGYIQEDEEKYLVKVGDELTSLEELENLLLFNIDVEGVGDIYLKDIAEVSYTDNSDEMYAKINGNDGIILSFQKQSTYSTSEVSNKINDTIEELQKNNQDMHITALEDQGIYINIVIHSVLSNLILGGILAIIILLLFLRNIKPTIIIAFSIPISLLFALVMMYFSGVTMNVISLAGLALGVGMLVDNSIVVIENIYRLRNEGMSAIQAAVKGSTQVAGAILASTLTTICVFLPIVFTEGISRQLFTDMGLTIAYSLIASLIVALTLVPTMSSTMLKTTVEKEHKFFNKFIKIYSKALKFALRYKPIFLILVVVLLVSSTVISISRGSSLMPEMDSTQISVSMTMDNDTKTTDLREMSNTIIDRISEIDDVDTIGAMQNSSSMSLMGGGDSKSISLYVILKDDKKLSSKEVGKLIEDKTKDLNCEINVTTSTMDMSDLGGSGISLSVEGDDLDKIKEIANDIADIISKVDGTIEVSNGQEDTSLETRITVDKNKAMEYGLTVAQVYQAVAQEISLETTSTSLSINSSDYPVIIAKDSNNTLKRDNIKDLEIKGTKNGNEEKIALSEIATISEENGLSSINHINQTRAITVSAAIDAEHNVGNVSKAVEKEIDKYELPEGYTIEIGGESDSMKQAFGDLILMIAMAIVFIYLIMVAQFQSLLSPFIVLFTIPLAFTGGFLALIITGFELNMISILGFLMLAGIVVNNGIVFVDYVNQLRLGGMKKKEALIEAGKARIRPILMTALTTILGLSTLAMGIGMGADMIQPMAIVTIGGLTYATVLTLFIVPIMYDILHRRELKPIIIEESI